MGVYYHQYENDCPRCGEGKVSGVFISVSPMSMSESCSSCGARDFTDEEKALLGDALPVYFTKDGFVLGKKQDWGITE